MFIVAGIKTNNPQQHPSIINPPNKIASEGVNLPG
jgi:hypothetical protein